jgi:hypothetical protein
MVTNTFVKKLISGNAKVSVTIFDARPSSITLGTGVVEKNGTIVNDCSN